MMESELRCPVCGEFFEEPVMLQCTHHICKSHVASLLQGNRITCPVCGDVTIMNENTLRVDRTLQVVVEMWGNHAAEHAPQQTGDATIEMCGFCEEKPATRRCIQCAGVLCEECEKTVHSKGFFKTHKVVDLDKGTEVTDNSSLRMYCDEHPDEKLSFYCLDCRKPVCAHCLILGDHKGHQQTPIDQAFETGKETLGAWVEKLKQRIGLTEDLLEALRLSECEVDKGAEAQRGIINHEMDHLRELIETKRHQLLSKSALEEKQKRAQLQGQIDKADSARRDARGLVQRSQDLLSVNSEHAFLAVVLPLIQDMKKCASQPVDDAPRVHTMFRPLSTDAQVRILGELDLGHPRPPQPHVSAVQPTLVGHSAQASHMTQQGQQRAGGQLGTGGLHVAEALMTPGYNNVANATLNYLPQQTMPPVQYVYRTVTS